MIRQGDKVFFSVNSAGPSSYTGPAFQTIQALGLVPLVYAGAGLDINKSNLDREMRDDFYQSKVVLLLLGTGQGWRSIGDNWAILEMNHALSMGIECLFYIMDEVTQEQVRNLNLPIDAVVIRDENHFTATLKQDLQQLMTIP